METKQLPTKEEYYNNRPFPHCIVDDFFDSQLLEDVLLEFPDLSLNHEIFYKNKNEEKYASKKLKPKAKELVDYLNSELFIKKLTELTGIDLIADVSLEGGGYHEIKKDGKLGVHIDFSRHGKLDLRRRLNLLIYLNKNWEENYNGQLIMTNNDRDIIKKIDPLFNRVVIFNTTKDSWHGHPDPLNCPDNMSRKSIALYYYSSDPSDDLKDHDTVFM